MMLMRAQRSLSRAVVRPLVSLPRRSTTGETTRCLKPDMAVAQAMPRFYYEFPNETLLLMAASGDHEARRERLTREIMFVDKVSWDAAAPAVNAITRATHNKIWLQKAPFRLVIWTALLAGFASFPLCFNLEIAKAFNDACVTAEVAAPEDLETWLEVGSWTWNWMEPPLGQISFFILCLQLARDQGANIGKKSMSEILTATRALNVAKQFPQYNDKIVQDFVETEINEDPKETKK